MGATSDSMEPPALYRDQLGAPEEFGFKVFRELGPVANHGVRQRDLVRGEIGKRIYPIQCEQVVQTRTREHRQWKAHRREQWGRRLVVELIDIRRHIIRQQQFGIACRAGENVVGAECAERERSTHDIRRRRIIAQRIDDIDERLDEAVGQWQSDQCRNRLGVLGVGQRSNSEIIFRRNEVSPFVVIGAEDHRHAIEVSAGKSCGRRLIEQGSVDERIDRRRLQRDEWRSLHPAQTWSGLTGTSGRDRYCITSRYPRGARQLSDRKRYD